jgi:hypothetical protein
MLTLGMCATVPAFADYWFQVPDASQLKYVVTGDSPRGGRCGRLCLLRSGLNRGYGSLCRVRPRPVLCIWETYEKPAPYDSHVKPALSWV